MRLVIALLFLIAPLQELKVQWIHGSDPCSANTDPAFQIYRFDANTFILRENKCINYEGPFIYLLFGRDKVFMQDTGAAPDPNSQAAFPIYETVRSVIDRWLAANGRRQIRLVVTHSHAHGDHIGGDGQFVGKPDAVLVGTTPGEVQDFFGIENWPSQNTTYDLGGRVLNIIPIPGHEPSSIAVYDRSTKTLLTGDTLYPGRLYVRDWPAYKASIARLVEFSRTHEIARILGTHIEMTGTPEQDYPVRTTYQPQEHRLELRLAHLLELHEALNKLGAAPKLQPHRDFIIYPR